MKNKILTFIIILVLSICEFSIVNAASNESSKLIMEPNGQINQLKEGNEIKILIKTKTESNNKIEGFLGTIEYDSNIFELLGEENNDMITLESSNNWETSIAKSTNKIIGIKSVSNENEDVCVLAFKVKNGVNVKNTMVKLKNLEVVNNNGESSMQDDIYLNLGTESIQENKKLVIIAGSILILLIIVVCTIIIIKKKR